MDIKELLFDLLYAVITAVIPILTVYFIKFWKAKREQIDLATDDFILQSSLQSILETIEKAVLCTSQTYVDSLKQSGQFNEEAQIIAFNKSKENILQLLSEESKLLIQNLYNDLDTWLEVQIEAAVSKHKLANKEGDRDGNSN